MVPSPGWGTQRTNLAGPDPFGLVRPLYYFGSGNTRELPVLPGLSAELRAVNEAGVAVGYSFAGNGSMKTPTTGFVFRNTAPTPTTTPLASLPGGTTSKALAISGIGFVAGQSDEGDANRECERHQRCRSDRRRRVHGRQARLDRRVRPDAGQVTVR
jgi:hypothetical protein